MQGRGGTARVEGPVGSIRIHQALKKEGVFVSRNRVVRLMKLEGIAGARRHP